MNIAVIGANFGDEGKGLAVNYFTKEGKNLVVRHNGGAQSGHTVEVGDKRFVFHELGSGSFNDAATYWDVTYHPDLYVFNKEFDDFYNLTKKHAKIYCHKDTKITIIDDVFLNCFKETQKKAGSCGMGIWECVCRNNAGYGLTIQEVKDLSVRELYHKLLFIRTNYTLKRLNYLRGKFGNNEFSEKMNDAVLLYNYAVAIKYNVDYIEIIEAPHFLFDKFDNVIFENGQGLLLDGDYDVVHGTPSKTGLYNVVNSLAAAGRRLDEAVYVTRTYLTRHGRGDFVAECDDLIKDDTNVYNEWQEGIRYGRFDSLDKLKARVNEDCKVVKPHLLITHTNVTDGKMLTATGAEDIKNLDFEKIYISDNKFTVNKVIV